MYVCLYIRVYICVYMCVYICVCMSVSLCMCMCVYTMCTYVCVHMLRHNHHGDKDKPLTVMEELLICSRRIKCRTSCVGVVEFTRTNLWSPTILIRVEIRQYTGE